MPVDPARAKTLFLAASDVIDAAERAAFLDRECGADTALRARVEALLRADVSPDVPTPAAAAAIGALGSADRPTGTFGSGAGSHQTASLSGRDECIGALIAGKYKLVEEIGEGGMGSVFMAQQTEPVKRAVAVKVIKAGMDSKAVLARFDAERQALAMMDHPNIAKVLDGGTTESGRPFFVMELVKGVPITQFCDDRKLTVRERLALFVPVCQAIQHAHQKGVIHRDIKPSNVLIALYDDKPVPKVIDFGIAKAAGPSLTDQTLMTGFGAVVGTPEYMSPEQASLNNLDIDTRSDVYALGVLLYELLTGTTPVDRKSLGKAALLEVLRIVREVETARPSAKLSTIDTLPSVAACRGVEPAKLSRLMRGELDWVLLKALEKDRTRRYESASGFAADVQRYLSGEAVQAHPPSSVYRLRKFVRRNKGQVIAASVILFALLAGMAGTSWGLIEAKRQESEARRQEGIAREEADEKEKARAAEADRVTERDQALAAEAERVRERDGALRREAERSDELKHRLGVSQFVLTNAALDKGDVVLAAERLDLVPPEQRGWDWRYLKHQTEGGIFTLKQSTDMPGDQVFAVAFSPDGKRIATGHGSFIKEWDAKTGQLLFKLPLTVDRSGMYSGRGTVSYSPDGSRLLHGGGRLKPTVWDVRNRKVILELDHPKSACAVFSPDGNRIAVAGNSSKVVRVWDAHTGKLVVTLNVDMPANIDGDPIYALSYSPDGKRIVGCSDELFRVWDAEKGGTALLKLNQGAESPSFSPDGTRIVLGRGGNAYVIDAKDGSPVFTLNHSIDVRKDQRSFLSTGLRCAAYSPDGTRIVTGGGDGQDANVKVWDARTGKELFNLKGHRRSVRDVVYSPDGTQIVTGGFDLTAKVWDARTGIPRIELKGLPNAVNSVAFSPDGSRIVTGGFREDGWREDVWSDILNGGWTPRRTEGHATVWDARTGRRLLSLKGLKSGVSRVAYSRDGKLIATAGATPDISDRSNNPFEVKIWDAETGALVHDLADPNQRVFGGQRGLRGGTVVFSPNGSRLVVTGLGGKPQPGVSDTNGPPGFYDVQTGKLLFELTDVSGAPLDVAFNADGTRIIVCHTRYASVWDVRSTTPTLLVELKGHTGDVNSAAFSPDGKLIVTGSSDGSVRLWDARTGSTLVELQGHIGHVRCATFTPDGTRIFAGGRGEDSRNVRAVMWELPPLPTPPKELNGHADIVTIATFNSDGTQLVTGSKDRTARVWNVQSGECLFELKGHTEGIVSVAYSEDGKQIVTEARPLAAPPGQSKQPAPPKPEVKVWDAATGQELPGAAIPKTVPPSPISPNGALHARVQDGSKQVLLVPLQPNAAELAYRLVRTETNTERYLDGYLAALDAKDDFAMAFYRNLIPEANRTELIRKARIDLLTARKASLKSVNALVPVLKELLELQTAQLGAEHVETIEVMYQLGSISRRVNLDEAVSMLEGTVRLLKAKPGPSSPELLSAMFLLSETYYWWMKDVDKARALLEELVKSCSDIHGDNHPRTLDAKLKLSRSYRDLRRYDAVIALLENVQTAAINFDPVASELLTAYRYAGEHEKIATLLLKWRKELQNQPQGQRI